MIPCNGRFPTLILLAGLAFGIWAPLAVGGCVVLGVLGAMLTSGVLSKTALKHTCSHFLMEIPPLRRPRIGQILVRSLLDRTIKIAGRALVVAAPAGVLLWVLAQLGWLRIISALLNPLAVFLGLNGVILLGFVLSLPANELLIPVVLMTMTGAGSLQAVGTGNVLMMLGGLSLETLLCTMIFTLFHWPCATTLLTVKKETGSIKYTLLSALIPTLLGLILCLAINLFSYIV
jgi:ferrous iron transport protein B